MNEATNNKTLFAVLMGVAIGLLFAPKEGKKLRAEVGDKFDDARNGTLKATDNAKLKWYEMRNKAEAEVEEITDEAKNTKARINNK